MPDIVTPALGESVSEATVARWSKQPGDRVKKDEVLVELETDKVGLEVASPADGVLGEILAAEGATVTPGAKLGSVGEAGAAPSETANRSAQPTAAKADDAILSPIPAGDGPPAPGDDMPGAAEAGASGQGGDPAVMPKAATDYPADDASAADGAPAARGAALDLTTPSMGESVTEGTVARWTRAVGDPVKKDEVLVEIETDKVAVEVVSPADGTLSEIAVAEGASVTPGALIGRVTPGGGVAAAPAPTASTPASGQAPQTKTAQAPDPAAASSAAMPISPAPRRVIDEGRLDPASISGTGKDGRITKGDALAELDRRAREAAAPPPVQAKAAPATPPSPDDPAPREERVRMSRLRQTIARRLKEAQNTAAMLTTFNEVDMGPVMDLRAQYKDAFEKRHGVKLGFMSFFAKAAVAALKEIPAVNAEIDGTDIVYKNRYDIGVAVGTDRGLVVPVVRDADRLSMAEIEKTIGGLGAKARDNTLSIEEMQGGTFTISNGGVYGSLMSTPILNAPQSGILGMHKIQDRPMAIDGKIEIRPMMYLALSYDHRIVDGKEAVTFLVRIKEIVEAPQRLLLEV